MKKLIAIAVLCISIAGCKSNKEDNVTVKETEVLNVDAVCEMISEEVAQSIFSDANVWTSQSLETPYPFCSRSFDNGGNNHGYLGITVAVDEGTESQLNTSMSYLKMDKEAIDGVGEKAYYIDLMGQLSFIENGNMYHLSVTHGGKGSKEKVLALYKKVFNK